MKWIKYEVDVADHPWHCSNCGWSWDGWNYKMRQLVSEFNFCPICGEEAEECYTPDDFKK